MEVLAEGAGARVEVAVPVEVTVTVAGAVDELVPWLGAVLVTVTVATATGRVVTGAVVGAVARPVLEMRGRQRRGDYRRACHGGEGRRGAG